MLGAPLLQARRAEGLPAGVRVPRPTAGLLGGSGGLPGPAHCPRKGLSWDLGPRRRAVSRTGEGSVTG